MVVKQEKVDLFALDIAYLGLFLGLRCNELVLDRLETEGFGGFRESLGYAMQHFVDADRTVSELARRMEVSQQAASKVVAELQDMELLEVVPGEDRRTKRLRMSEQGRSHLAIVRETRRELERRLIRKLGKKSYETVRSALIESLHALGATEKILSRRVRTPR